MFANLERCPCCNAAEGPAGLGRRGLFGAALGVAATTGLACTAAKAQFAQPGAPRQLMIQRLQTGETFQGVYWRDGRYVRDALNRLNWVFRDPALAEATPMDPRLFDVLHSVASLLDSAEYFQVISGYRTPESNAQVVRENRHAARSSLHMSGMAADVRLPDRDSMGLARLAAEMQVGGVGLYRRDGFVHLDCGPARRWS